MKYTLVAIAVALIGFANPTYAQMDDSILVDDYIISQDFIQAEIIRVNPIERSITVRGEKRGDSRKFYIPEEAMITVRGRQARMRDLRAGDIILLAMKPKAEGVAVVRIKAPEVTETLESRRAAPVAAPVVNEVMPRVLPKTASNLPFILLIGIISLLGGGLLLRRRVFKNKVK